MEFEMNGEKYAFLSQMNSLVQQFDFLKWNEKSSQWEEQERYPMPAIEAYFSDLSPADKKLIKEYGSDFIYLNPGSKSATFIFSEQSTQMNMGEKELLEFELKPTYSFDLFTDQEVLYIESSPLNITGKNDLFFVAYSKHEKRSKEFTSRYNKVLASLANFPINTQIITYGENDFNVFFPADTFDFRYMEQFEPRDGFWFYRKGDEPLDLGADEPVDEVIQRVQTYFERTE
jgi:hypothetical protein